MASESEGIVQGHLYCSFLRLVERKIEIVVNIRILMLENYRVPERMYAGQSLDGSRSTQQMTVHGFGRTDIEVVGMLSEQTLHGFQFSHIPQRCGCSVNIDVIHILGHHPSGCGAVI